MRSEPHERKVLENVEACLDVDSVVECDETCQSGNENDVVLYMRMTCTLTWVCKRISPFRARKSILSRA